MLRTRLMEGVCMRYKRPSSAAQPGISGTGALLPSLLRNSTPDNIRFVVSSPPSAARPLSSASIGLPTHDIMSIHPRSLIGSQPLVAWSSSRLAIEHRSQRTPNSSCSSHAAMPLTGPGSACIPVFSSSSPRPLNQRASASMLYSRDQGPPWQTPQVGWQHA